jgi:hypothetical protein
MARKQYPQAYTDGIVYGYAEAIKPPAGASLVTHEMLGVIWEWAGISRSGWESIPAPYDKVVFHATSNGKTWSYALRPNYTIQGSDLSWLMPGAHYCPKTATRRAFRNRAAAENPWHDLVAWAFRDMAKRAQLCPNDPGVLQMNVAYEREAPAQVGKVLPGPCGPITYTGYPARIGHYDVEDIHDVVVKAVADVLPHWAWQGGRGPWRPSHLEVMMHSGKRTLGLAFAPGTGHERNKRTISLNDIMFKLYSADAIWRVVVHELCHHYRDEVFASNDVDAATADRLRQSLAAHPNKAFRNITETLGTHDSVFVRELAKVDKKVDADPYAGICFNEYADPSLVADAKAVKEAKMAKADWRPEAGRIWIDRLKSGQFSVWWVELSGSKRKVGMLGNAMLNALIVRLHGAAAAGANMDSASARRTMQTGVTLSDTWPFITNRPSTLIELMQLCEQRWHFNFSGSNS